MRLISTPYSRYWRYS